MKPHIAFLGISAAGLLAACTCDATIIAAPAVLAGSTPFSGAYPHSASVDGSNADFASAGAGAGTFLEFDFGGTTSFDRVIPINRDSPAGGDLFSQVTMTFSADPVFDGGDETETIATLAQRGRSLVHGLSQIRSDRHVRFDVDTLAGGDAFNTGAMEMLFLQTPADTQAILSVGILNAAASFNADYAAANSVNGVVGYSLAPAGIEYASAGLGADAFVDFDFGVELRLAGFDLIDRLGAVDRTTSFDLVLSNDPSFTSPLATLSFSKGSSLTYSGTFDAQTVRYVRYDVTGTAAGNTGLSEIIFYESTVPEPAGGGLLLLGAVMLRRRWRGTPVR